MGAVIGVWQILRGQHGVTRGWEGRHRPKEKREWGRRGGGDAENGVEAELACRGTGTQLRGGWEVGQTSRRREGAKSTAAVTQKKARQTSSPGTRNSYEDALNESPEFMGAHAGRPKNTEGIDTTAARQGVRAQTKVRRANARKTGGRRKDNEKRTPTRGGRGMAGGGVREGNMPNRCHPAQENSGRAEERIGGGRGLGLKLHT